MGATRGGTLRSRLPYGLRRRLGPIRDTAVHATAQLTPGAHVMPDFLIIGAAKSGTSSLREALDRHPSVRMTRKPEVHYFDLNHTRSSDWYRSHFAARRTQVRLLADTGEFAAGEKTPRYLADPAVPERVARLLPHVKLLVLLRDPVARAVSHCHHEQRRGREPRPLQQALFDELRASPDDADPLAYIARGRYWLQLQRWLRYFDPNQMHVSLSERLFADPVVELAQIERFLGLTPCERGALPHTNRGFAADALPAKLADRVRRALDDDVGRLAEWLGVDPGWW